MTTDQTENDARIEILKQRRAAALVVKASREEQHRTTKGAHSKAALLAANEALTAINDELRECGMLSHQDKGGGIVKTKRELIGSLSTWMGQMQDANKNPRTSPGEKLFNQRAIERLAIILKANE